MVKLTDEQVAQFERDGVLIVDELIDQDSVDRALARYGPLFRGEFETGILPDEVNWQDGRDSEDLSRQICNGWKADRTIAGIVFRADIARAICRLAGWPGVRLMIDNVIWKPPGARPLGFHQDNAYLAWLRPSELLTCWIALDETTAEGGTMEVVRGSHKWAHSVPEGEFHGPTEYRKYMEIAAAKEGVEPDIVPIVAPRGGGSFHHGWVWHGSGFNRSGNPRRSLIVHAMSSAAEYVPEMLGQGTGPVYGRYKKFGSDEIDESYFPILWTRDGRRTKGIDDYANP